MGSPLGTSARVGHCMQIAILIVIAIVGTGPGSPTYVAELVLAPAGHVVAALVLFDHEATFFALSVVQIILKKLHFLLVAFPLVGCQEALPAEFLPARITHHHAVHRCLYYSLTVLAGA